jgi:hypothetical protein
MLPSYGCSPGSARDLTDPEGYVLFFGPRGFSRGVTQRRRRKTEAGTPSGDWSLAIVSRDREAQ